MLVCDKTSDYDKLKEALNLIEKALEIKKGEKIFQQRKEYLRMLNLQNTQEIYEEHLLKTKEKLQTKLEEDSKEIRSMLLKVKDKFFINSVLGNKKKEEDNSTTVHIDNESHDFELISMFL